MNNSLLMNKLKNKNLNLDQQRQNINYNPQNVQKYNPDVNNKYQSASNKRDNTNYDYTTDIWKPIIGSIKKANIHRDDLKVAIDKVDPSVINNKYQQEIEERQRENERVKQIMEAYNREMMEKGGMPKPQLELEPFDQELLNKVDNTFLELKSNANDITKNNNNIDPTLLMESIKNLDSLMDSIKDL